MDRDPVVAHKHRGAVRDSVPLWLEPVFVALAGDRQPGMTMIVIGMRQMIGTGDAQTAWHLVMATALLAVLPPVAIALAMRRWFVAGLIEPEK